MTPNSAIGLPRSGSVAAPHPTGRYWRRFKERKVHPLKQWKLSPIDMASLDKWDDYTRAKEAMFFHTDTADSPWTVVKSDDKKRARLKNLMGILGWMSALRSATRSKFLCHNHVFSSGRQFG